ncbi:hypothetical protein GGX14DRAFT_428785 [Mycena pura]|uniref:NmrA-like domain-containing protein n=1 Tax=Mycena pura TaxID=153505 RepID=A0AAD6YL76_9AGAR|nr:hypothetical protein GGX14DRAFT_428785 [Mycena pura]
MSAYNVYAIAGLGRIGLNMTRDLLAMKAADGHHYSVRVLTQSPDSPALADLKARGADVRTVSYAAPASLRAALDGVDVLISAIGYHGLEAQDILCDAAADARVQLFVPSEYGALSNTMVDPVFAGKEHFRARLVAAGLKYTVFYSGLWADFDLRPFILREWFEIDLEGGSIHKWSNWDVPWSFTTQSDVSRFVTHVLVHLSRSELENRIIRIEGDRQSLNSLFSTFLAKTGRRPLEAMNVTTHTRAELDARLEKDPALIGMRLLRAGSDEKFSVTADGDPLDNDLWPEWNPEKAGDVIIASFAADSKQKA